MTKMATHSDVTRAHAKIAALEERIAKLEKWAHEPFDFNDLISRLERLERIERDTR